MSLFHIKKGEIMEGRSKLFKIKHILYIFIFIIMQHIDKKKLYSDSKYRFDYVAAYMGFGKRENT
jgi:hypothetical protein